MAPEDDVAMPDPHLAEVREVLGHYGLNVMPGQEPRPFYGGFSGADVWAVPATIGPICVRRWPEEHPTPAGLRWMHDVLQTVVAASCRFVPNPLPASDGNTVTQLGGRLWEVTPWMLGIPDRSPRVSEARCHALWRALAQFHCAVAAAMHDVPRGRSPGLTDRLQKVDQLAEELARLRFADKQQSWGKLDLRLHEYVRLAPAVVSRVRESLTAVVNGAVPLVPCIRDIRRDHVLFSDNEVTGWVDFGALAIENPAADVARVLREFFDDEEEAWPTLLRPYDEAVARSPLGSCSLRLVDAFDRSGILLSPANWLRWIYLEGRSIEGFEALVDRMDELLRRLRRLVETA